MSAASSGDQRRRPDGLPIGHPFRKGVSGNPSGMGRAAANVIQAAREYTVAAVARLVALMQQDATSRRKSRRITGWLFPRRKELDELEVEPGLQRQ